MPLRPSSVFLRFEIKRLDQASSRNRNDYLEGQGRYIYKDVEKNLSDDDLRIEQHKTQEIERRNSYLERTGAFAGKNGMDRLLALDIDKDDGADRPGHGATWDRSGICDSRQKAAEIIAATEEGYYVDGVITISREDVSLLGLETKQDFQRIVRAHLDGLIDSWKLFEPGDSRWYAEYHTDARHSLHVHLTIWDASGRWAGAKRIPDSMMFYRQQLIQGDDYFRAAIYQTIKPELSKEKDFLRNRLQAELYRSLGYDVPKTILQRCDTKVGYLTEERIAQVASFDVQGTSIDPEDLNEYLDRIKSTLPEEGRGSIRYAYASEETKAAVNSLLRHLYEINPSLKGLRDLYLDNVKEHGALKGLSGNPLKRFMADDKISLERPLKNILLKAAAGLGGYERIYASHHQPSPGDMHQQDLSRSLLTREATKTVIRSAEYAFNDFIKENEIQVDEPTSVFEHLFSEAKQHARLSGSISAYDIASLVDAYKRTPLFGSIQSNSMNKDILGTETMVSFDKRAGSSIYQYLCHSIEDDIRSSMSQMIDGLDMIEDSAASSSLYGLSEDRLLALSALMGELNNIAPAKTVIEAISGDLYPQKSQVNPLLANKANSQDIEDLLGKDAYKRLSRLATLSMRSNPALIALSKQERYWIGKRMMGLLPHEQA